MAHLATTLPVVGSLLTAATATAAEWRAPTALTRKHSLWVPVLRPRSRPSQETATKVEAIARATDQVRSADSDIAVMKDG
jgi:hypothetical protein